MRVIVTGGAGFIGSHLADALLERGDEVWVVDNFSSGKLENVHEDAQLVERDIREALEELFEDVQPEVCFHLAAQADVRVAVEQPHYDADVNVLGTIRVLEAVRKVGAQVVFSSTGGAIYGVHDGLASEDLVRSPISPYGVSKLAGEEYLATANRLYGTRHTTLRYANVYGPRQDPHGEAGVVAIFFGRLADGKQSQIFGDGTQTRDYVYVADVVRATLAGAGKGGVFNVGTGVETSVQELYDRCRRIAGSDVEAKLAPPRPGELQRSALDAGLAERELGWRPKHDLDEGLEETWRSIAGR